MPRTIKKIPKYKRRTPALPPNLPPATPVLTLTDTPEGLRLQSSLDYMADGIGGRSAFLQACQLCDTEEAKNFMAACCTLDPDDPTPRSLQDTCVALGISPTELLSQVIAASVLAQNNIALWISALQRPSIMQASLAKARDVDHGGEERRMQFEMAGLLKGGGTVINQINQLGIQVKTPEGTLSFEEDANMAVSSVRSGTPPRALPAPARPELEINPESDFLEGTLAPVPAYNRSD